MATMERILLRIDERQAMAQAWDHVEWGRHLRRKGLIVVLPTAAASIKRRLIHRWFTFFLGSSARSGSRSGSAFPPAKSHGTPIVLEEVVSCYSKKSSTPCMMMISSSRHLKKGTAMEVVVLVRQ